jgi:hypothetical protein
VNPVFAEKNTPASLHDGRDGIALDQGTTKRNNDPT